MCIVSCHHPALEKKSAFCGAAAVSVIPPPNLAVKLRAKRMEAGALTLASPEVRFKLDSETQDPTDVKMYNLKQANALVEEFMLFANITVAKKILEVSFAHVISPRARCPHTPARAPKQTLL